MNIYPVHHHRSPVKIDTTQDVDFYAYTSKQHAFLCPPLTDDISSLFEYTQQSEIAIVLPIFVSWKSEYSPYIDALSKVTPYLLKDILTKTDIQKYEIPVYVAVSEEAIPIAEPYMRAAGVPEENIIFFEAHNYHVANKIMCILDPFFDKFQKVVWCDIMHTIILPNKETLLPFGRILEAWDSDSQPLLIPRDNFRVKFRHPNDKKFEVRKSRFMFCSDIEAESYANAVEHIYINGWINGFGKALREGELKERIQYLCEITNGQNDEYVTEVIASEIGLDRVANLSTMGIPMARTHSSWTPSIPYFQTLNGISEHYWDG